MITIRSSEMCSGPQVIPLKKRAPPPKANALYWRCEAPNRSCALYSRKNETPSAEISGAIRGAVRSGRYANRSIATPSPAQPTIATMNISTSTIQIEITGFVAPPNAVQDAEADVGADHVHVAVREVQELQDPVDHRVAQRDERVDAPERQAVDEELDEFVDAHFAKRDSVTNDVRPDSLPGRTSSRSVPLTQPTSLIAPVRLDLEDVELGTHGVMGGVKPPHEPPRIHCLILTFGICARTAARVTLPPLTQAA